MFYQILKYIWFTATFIGHIYLWTAYTTDVFPPKKELSIEIIAFLAILVMIAFLLKRKYMILRKVLQGVLLYSLLGVFSGWILNQYQYYNNDKIAEEFINQLEIYNVHKGHYPISLKDMIPTYRKNYPHINYGLTIKELGYTAIPDDYSDYLLFMELPNGAFKKFIRNDKKWEFIKRPFR